MPGPNVGIGVAVGLAAAPIGTAAAGVVNAFLAPHLAEFAQDQWEGNPVLIPDAAVIIDMHRRNYIDTPTAVKACAKLGVSYTDHIPSKIQDLWSRVWTAYGIYSRSVPSVELAMRSWAIGLYDDQWMRLAVRRAGGNAAYFGDVKDVFLEAPSTAQVMTAWAQRLLTDSERQKLIRRAGADADLFMKVQQLYESVPQMTTIMEAYNRGIIPDKGKFDAAIDRLGYTAPYHHEFWDRMRQRLPGVSDLIQMMVREAFKPEIANKLGLYDEHPTQLEPWFKKHGMDYLTDVEIQSDGVGRFAQPLDLYWAAHWIQPSAGQIFQMRHRFRPSRMKRFTDTGLKVEPFDQERVRSLLKLIDYPPWARDYLTGLSFTPLRLIDIRNAYRFKIISREEAIEQFQDRGVHPDDAKVQADLVEMQEQNKRYAWLDRLENNLSGQVVREILSSYEDGIHTQEQAAAQLNALIPYVETVNTLIHLVESRLGRRLAREGIRSVRRDYLNGTLSAAETSSQLSAMGIVDQRIAGYIALWSIQRNRTRRMASTAQIVGWVGKGMLHPTVARERLLNLGWDEPDVVIMLDEQAGKLAALDAKRRAVADQAARTRAKELESLQRTAERQRKALEADQRRATPRSTLDRWLCNGEISETFYLQRMRAMGYPSRIAHGYLIDAKRKKACAPAPEGSPFPPTNNGESDTGDSAGQSSGNGAANP